VIPTRRRSTLVTILDLLCLAAIAIAAFALFADLDRFRLFGIRVSLRSPQRALAWPLGIVALRLILWWRTPLFPAFRQPVAALLRAFTRALVDGSKAVERKVRRWPSRFMDRANADQIAFAHPAGGSGHLKYYVAALVVLCLVPLWPQLINIRAVPDPGDPFFSAWRLAWVAHQLVTAPGHLFDANIFYPTPLALTYSDSTLLPGIVAAPFIWVGADPLTVANVMFVAAFPLAGLAFFLAARRLTGDVQASFIAGVLGGLAPFHFEHYSHFELQFFFWIPLAIIALLNVLTSGRMTAGIALGVLVAGQCLTSMYFGGMLLTYLVPFGLAVALGWQVRPSRRLAQALLATAVIVATTLAMLGTAYLQSRSARGERSLEYLTAYSATPVDYLQSNYRSATYRNLLHNDPQPERQLFPGAAPVALGLIALIPPVPVPAAAAVVAGTLAADWSLGVNGFTYRLLYRWLPPYRSMRVPARFALFVDASLVLLSAYGAHRAFTACARDAVCRADSVGSRRRMAASDASQLLRVEAADLHRRLIKHGPRRVPDAGGCEYRVRLFFNRALGETGQWLQWVRSGIVRAARNAAARVSFNRIAGFATAPRRHPHHGELRVLSSPVDLSPHARRPRRERGCPSCCGGQVEWRKRAPLPAHRVPAPSLRNATSGG
jgi:hypothetical protein